MFVVDASVIANSRVSVRSFAESLDCPLLTADRRLASAPGPECEFIVLGSES